MPKKTRILIVRRAESKEDSVVLGSKDSEISMLGMAAAEKLARKLKTEDINVVYSSPLKRAFDTARIVSKYHDLTPAKEQSLSERRFGRMEGQKAGDDLPHGEIEGAEKEEKFKKRVLGFINRVLSENKGQTILIVTHLGVFKAIVDYLLEADKTKSDDLKKPSYCGMAIFDIGDLAKGEIKVEMVG